MHEPSPTRLRTAIAAAVALLLLAIAGSAHAQVTKPGGGFVPPGKIGNGAGGGAGTITGVTAGTGLTGGGSSGSVTLSLLTSCSSTQILKWSGSAWACAADATGITGATTAAASGLTGGCTSGTCALSLLTSCSNNQVLVWTTGTSSWGCATPTTGTVTSVATGTGLTGGPITTSGTLSLNITGTTCAAHKAEITTASDGTSTCGTFLDGATVNGGLTLSTSTLGLLTSCSNGQVLQWTTGTTSWGCATPTGGTVTSITAGTGLSGGTITGTGTIAVNLTTTTCSAHQAEITTSATGTSTCSTFVDGVTTGGGLALSTSTLGLITSCGTNNVLAWNGTAWACAAPTTGTVTSITAGTGLSGGTITNTGTVALNINGGTTQTCGAGNAVTAVTGAGITTCTAFGTSSLTNSAGNNVVAKGNGFGNLVASSLTDNGTTVSTSEPISGTGGATVASGLSTDAITVAVMRPASVSGPTTVNNWAPTDVSSGLGLSRYTVIQVTAATGTVSISGLAAPTSNVDGRQVCLYSNTAQAVQLLHESASSTAANRFTLASGATWILPAAGGQSLCFAYDNTTSRWKQLGGIYDHPSLIVDGAATADGGNRVFDTVGTGLARDGTNANQVDLSINGGTTQTCAAGKAVTALTGVGATTCTSFGTSSLTNAAGANVVAKSDGTNLIASSITDNGTTVATTEGVTADSGNRVFDAVGAGLARDGTNAFQVDLNLAGASCSTNTVMTALGATGTGTCAAPPSVTSGVAGYAPASGGGTTNFLRADGTWTAPPGTGGLSGGTPGATPVWATSSTLGNGTTTDNGTTFKVGNVAGTIAQDSTATGTTNDYALGATTTVLVFTNATGPTLTGIAGGVAGRLLYVGYGGATSTTFSNENASSVAANRIHCPTNANCTLSANGAGLWLVYDDTLSRWRPVFTTTLPTLTVSGATTLSSTLGVTGNATLVKTTVNGSSGNNSLIANLASTTQVATLAAFDANNSGTFNTTSSVLTAYGVNSTVSATRSSGANNLTDVAGYFTASGAQVNQALVADAGDVVLNNTSGTTTIKGAATITMPATNTTSLTLTNANTAQTVNGTGISISDTGTYDATAANRGDAALSIAISAARSTGANNLTNEGIHVDVTGGQTNYSIRTVDGDEIFNATSGKAQFFGGGELTNNSIFTVDSGSTLTVNGTLSVTTCASMSGQHLLIDEVSLTSSSGTYTPATCTTSVEVIMCGGGGGGGGAIGTASVIAAAGGGASGQVFDKMIACGGACTGGAYTTGAAGTAGAATPTNGGTGGDSTIVISGTTYTAKGGTGGNLVSTSGAAAVVGGTVGAGGSSGLFSGGQNGGPGLGLGAAVATSGIGGSAPGFGVGGASLATIATTGAAAGNVATGNCSGGGGAAAINTGKTGGAGTAGVIVLREYN